MSTWRFFLSVNQHYKNPANCVGLVQKDHHHLIECNLLSPRYNWKIAHLALNNNHSLTQENDNFTKSYLECYTFTVCLCFLNRDPVNFRHQKAVEQRHHWKNPKHQLREMATLIWCMATVTMDRITPNRLLWCTHQVRGHRLSILIDLLCVHHQFHWCIHIHRSVYAHKGHILRFTWVAFIYRFDWM